MGDGVAGAMKVASSASSTTFEFPLASFPQR